jgi:transposase
MRIITMSDRELKRSQVLEALKRKEITQKEVAARLNLSGRQVRRIVKRYAMHGAAGLAHKSRGEPSNRKSDPILKEKVLKLIQEKYYDCGPTFTAEKLAERDNIALSVQTVRRFMFEAGLWVKKRRHKQHRYWRKRKDYRGQMVQVDCSIHPWFAGSDQFFTYIRFVDDATSELLYSQFINSESNEGVMRATMEYFELHGIPMSIYTDKGKVFKVNHHNPDGVFITQYERILESLDVELIHAHSPQAKGCVERSFSTDQDRLVKELRLAEINTIDEANKFILEYYIPNFNKKFSCPPAKPDNLHRPANVNLADVFCICEERQVRNDWTVQYYNRIFQLHKTQQVVIRPKDRIMVYVRLDGSIFMKTRSFFVNFTEIYEKPKRIIKVEPKPYERIVYASKNHPWRRTNTLFASK